MMKWISWKIVPKKEEKRDFLRESEGAVKGDSEKLCLTKYPK